MITAERDDIVQLPAECQVFLDKFMAENKAHEVHLDDSKDKIMGDTRSIFYNQCNHFVLLQERAVYCETRSDFYKALLDRKRMPWVAILIKPNKDFILIGAR